MLISYRWLQRHVDLSGISPEQLCNDLTLSTAEVEGLERFAPHLMDVVVGHVTHREKHPDADTLNVCQVDVGSAAGDNPEPLTIVCGAPNVDQGQKVAVATVGTVLPGDFKIKKSKIRGVASHGMICSVRELELGEEHDGIWVLPESVTVGQPVAEALGIDDWVIEIDNKSLTHRPDLWGHRGIAGEIAAIYGRSLESLSFEWPALGQGESFPVQIETPACSRYLALPIDGAVPEPSPDWLKWLLLSVGQRPIDAVVDLSNFVMLDLGQPNHTFDRSRLSEEGIRVRMAHAEETLRTLDGEDRPLQESDILICSGDSPVALAGIMGGEDSRVAEESRQLLLEVACFDAVTVRRTSSRLGLRTDSSARFEKSLDPTLPEKAAAYFVRLLCEMQPGVTLPAPPTDVGDWSDPAFQLTLRPERVRADLGAELEDSEISGILERLGFGLASQGEELRVDVPSRRATKDISIERDLIEEVGRIHRYDSIAEKTMQASIAPPPHDPRRELVRTIQDELAGGARFNETLGYSFIDDHLLEKLAMQDLPHVQIQNPVHQAQTHVRRTVIPNLLGALESNRRLHEEIRLFEVGKGYIPEKTNERGEPTELHLAGLIWACAPPAKGAAFDDNRFSQLHGVVHTLLHTLKIKDFTWREAENRPCWAHPAKALEAVCEGHEETPLALVAALDPALYAGLGLDGDLASDVAAAEISLDALLEAPRRASHYEAVPRYPGIKVDVAIALSEDTPASAVEEVIIKAAKNQFAGIELFDLYRGENLGEGRKSLAYHVLLQSDNKTLSDKDEQKFLKRFEHLIGEIGGELRRG